MLDPVDILRKDNIPDTRIPTRKGLSVCWRSGAEEPDRFNLAATGHALPPPEIDVGDDMDAEESRVLNNDPTETLDRRLTMIWHQFLIDIIQKAPNPKGQMNGSYCRTKQEDRYTIQDAFYQNTVLSDIWHVCQYRIASSDLWTNTFTRLWPPTGHILSPSAQNYSTCRYYLDWKRFISDGPDQHNNSCTQGHQRKIRSSLLDTCCQL
jgi:hypothetical protein